MKRPLEEDSGADAAEAAAAEPPNDWLPSPPPARRFAGRRVLVTGGSQGIGRSVAESFLHEGARVFIADLVAPAPLDDVDGDGAGVRGGEAALEFLRCDAAEPADIARACEAAAPVDVLVNNVAVQPEAPCHEHSLDDWNRAIAVGLTSYFLFSKHLLPHMLERRKGVIVNIASVQGSQSQPHIPGYAAVKGGVLSLTRQLGVEYADRGIRVLSVSPGTIATPAARHAMAIRNSSEEEAGAAYPMKRIGRPAEVAKVVLFLASEDASFMTAENVTVDGGIMGLGGWAETA